MPQPTTPQPLQRGVLAIFRISYRDQLIVLEQHVSGWLAFVDGYCFHADFGDRLQATHEARLWIDCFA